MAKQIRTLLKHEDTSSSPDKERGSRYWVDAEILSTVWFVVDICIDVSSEFVVRRWVTTTIRDAALIQQRHKPFKWSQVFVSMRVSGSAPSGLLFEEVNEVYQSGPVGSYIYRLVSGLTFMSEHQPPPENNDEPEEFKLVFSKQH